MKTNTDRVGDALRVYSEQMKQFTIGALKAHYGEGKAWLAAYLDSFISDQKRANAVRSLEGKTEPEDVFDLNHVKDLFLGNQDVFRPLLGRTFNRYVTYADEISEVRNSWAHQQELHPDDVNRALDSMARVLVKIEAPEAAKAVKDLRDDVQPIAKTALGLSAWWELAEPHADIRQGNFDESTFAAKLDDVVDGNAAPEYLLAEEFYRKTYMTAELRGLLSDTLKRLAGTGGEAVVQLRTPFGGGKTHALIALYHLIKKAADIEGLADVQAILEAAGLKTIPHARTAVLVGTQPSAQGRDIEGFHVNTLWGDLAYQLGGENGYAIVKASDQARTSPGKDTLRRLFERVGKALILMDEFLVYQIKAAGARVENSNLQAQSFAFLQELTEVAGSVPGVAFITTYPESNTEYFDSEHAVEVYNRIEKILGRVQSIRIPVQGEEIFEVVRRRLFESIDDGRAKGIIAAYQQTYNQNRDDLPSETRNADFSRRMSRAYPFHPELISVLYERWGTLQNFQRTRGVLSLLARVVEYSYMSSAARPLISLGDMGLDDPGLRSAMTNILKGANWDSVIAADIYPGKAQQVDRETGGDYAKFRLAQSVATTIFMYSHSGGSSQSATESRLRLALLQPQGISSTLVSDAISRMKNQLYYLYGNGGWSFRAQPNLNSVLADRLSQVKPEAVEEKLREATDSIAGNAPFKKMVWPSSYRDVPDNTQLKFIVLKPPFGGEDDTSKRKVIQDNAAGSPRINKNTLIYIEGDEREFSQATALARTLLALEDVSSDAGLVLSEDQRYDLKNRLGATRQQLPLVTKGAYSYLYEPTSAAGEFHRHLIGASSKTMETVQAAAVEALRNADRFLSNLDPALIATYEPYQLWPTDDPTLSLRDLYDYFERYPHLPILESKEVLKGVVVRGVKNGMFEVAVKANDDFSQVWRRRNPPAENDLFFTENYLLTRPGCIEEKAPEEMPLATPINSGTSAPDMANTAVGEFMPQQEDRKIRKLSLRFERFDLSKITNLIDIAGALEDAGATVNLNVNVDATSSEGLDEDVLEMSVRELISQLGLDPVWEENT